MKKVFAVAMTLCLLAALAVPVFAAKSAEINEGKNTIKIVEIAGEGEAELVKNADNTVTLTATPKTNQSFQKWVIMGEYEIVSGSLEKSNLVIRPLKGDITVKAVFTGVGSTTPDNGSTSPQTGATTAVYVLTAVMALGVAAVAAKKKVND